MRARQKEAVPEMSEARERLTHHIKTVRRLERDLKEAADQQRWIGYIKQHETEARANLDAVKEKDARELAEALANPKGVLHVSDHEAIGHAEWELERMKRDADTARACEPEVVARVTAASNALSAARRETLTLAAEVILDEAPALAEEIAALSDELRAKHARLWGMKRFFTETAQILKMHERLPVPVHTDAINPEFSEIDRQAQAWRGLADRLSSNPEATIEEENAHAR